MAIATVKIKDGQGSFLTINKSDFKQGVHEYFEASEPDEASEPEVVEELQFGLEDDEFENDSDDSNEDEKEESSE